MAKVKTGPKTKRKGGGVAAKAKRVEGFAEQLKDARSVIVTDYRGLTVRDLQELRRRLRPKGVEYHVVKNSLFGRAASAAGKGPLAPMLGGPTALATGSADEVDLAKSLVDATRTLKAFRIVGALVGGRALSAEDVHSLARLPSRPQLQATIVWTLQSPLSSVVGVLTGAHSQLVRVFAAKGAQ